MKRLLFWLSIFSIAMAWVESAVVVYLRELYYPGGFSFPIVIIPDRLAAIEVAREASTLVMLAALSILAGASRFQRFLFFCLTFGVWDIFYYVWLRLLLGWPDSLLTWDILFLIPLPWIGPVLAPITISALLIVASLRLLWLEERGVRVTFSSSQWALAVAGGLVVLLSFMIDYKSAFTGAEPAPFRWGLFVAGIGTAVTALMLGLKKMQQT